MLEIRKLMTSFGLCTEYLHESLMIIKEGTLFSLEPSRRFTANAAVAAHSI